MKVLYFGTYDPDYSRNRVLIKGLRQNGVKVLECNDRSRSTFKYINLFFKYLKFNNKFDVLMVGFPGQEVMLLASLLTKKPIIFDTFTSHYGGHILDRGKYREGSLMSKWFRWIDKRSVQLSDVSLLDTNTHIDFFVKEFNLPRQKFRRVFVGTDSDVFYPNKISTDVGKFLVHFHGNFIPLQGAKYIIEAANILKNEGVVFNIIGRGQDYKESHGLAERFNLNNINFIDRVPYKKLAGYINESDVCLGIFGNSVKADAVIPNKIYEAIACAKPVITSDTNATRELFKDGENILFCEVANPSSLADKILLLKNDVDLRQKIGQGGYGLFKEKLTEEKIGLELVQILKSKL